MCSVVRDDPIHYSFFVLEALKIIKFWGGQRNKFLEIQMTHSSKKRFVGAAVTAGLYRKVSIYFLFFPMPKNFYKTTPPRTKIKFVVWNAKNLEK
jgi:hypothetical protein